MDNTGHTYEKLLHVAGGDLNLPKGHCYIITWNWTIKGVATMNKIAQNPADTCTTHSRGTEIVKIPRKETMDLCKTLSCYSAPIGRNKCRYDALMYKAIDLGAATPRSLENGCLHKAQCVLLHGHLISPRCLKHSTQRSQINRDEIHEAPKITNGLQEHSKQCNDACPTSLPESGTILNDVHKQTPPQTNALQSCKGN
jgi:hypothetical protein